jgi:uncharacterized RDD family membrane protein YckC
MAEARADTLQSVELADGVEIQLRVAGPAARSMAFTIDLLLRVAIYAAVGLSALFLLVGAIGPELTGGLFLLFMFLMEWFYNVFFEAGSHGATPGQRTMKLRVMSATGGPVTLAQAVLRNFLRVVDFMPGLYLTGILCMLFTKRFQRLGDLVANTVVTYVDPPPVRTAHTEFMERAPQWADERRLELSSLAEPLTGAPGMEGLRRLCGMGLWLQEPEEKNGKPPPLKGAPPLPA